MRHAACWATRRLLGNYLSGAGTSTLSTAAYDPVGNRLSVLELSATRVTYAYDAAYQLSNEQRSGANAYNTTYAYDPTGNRTLKNDSGQLTTYAYNAANAQILLTPPSGLPTTSSYDASGNLTLENTGAALATYTWDPENRLLQVVAAGTNARVYTYSADGHRQQAQVGPTQTFFVWDEENVLQEANASLVTNVAYVQAPEGWGGLIRQQGTQTQAYFGFDFEGSTRLLVRPNGTVVTAYDYKAFGEELQTGSSGSSYRYGGAWGYYRDLPTRLYIRARHLRTDLGRWISRDPIGFNGEDFNLYAFVDNNPVLHVDPSGNIRWTIAPACVNYTYAPDCPIPGYSLNCATYCTKQYSTPCITTFQSLTSKPDCPNCCSQCGFPCDDDRLTGPTFAWPIDLNQLEKAVADHLRQVQEQYRIGKRKTPNGDGFECPQGCENTPRLNPPSRGTHYQWTCNKAGGGPTSLVVTALCCKCFNPQDPSMKGRCKISKCHTNNLI